MTRDQIGSIMCIQGQKKHNPNKQIAARKEANLNMLQEKSSCVINEIVDALAEHSCTVEESVNILRGVRYAIEKTTVQKSSYLSL